MFLVQLTYPPIFDEKVKFYLPDTFAPKSNANPKELKEFQDFNLKWLIRIKQ